MRCREEMSPCVAVLGIVATSDVPARTAHAQMNPCISLANAVHAHSVRRSIDPCLIGVSATDLHGDCHFNPALSSPYAASADPGMVRNATFSRFQPLIAMMRNVRSVISFSESCPRTRS
jgi:hypothetical protein